MEGRRWTAAAAAVGLLASVFAAAASSADELPLLTPAPLPLAIRDGRVAGVTVNAVPFATGAKELAPGVAAALERLAVDAATDCFLTAQAVGHVLPGTPGDGDTLAAHRLARARAELVQSVLVRAGLPKDAIASVWDYQFTTREPRVTLWIFRLARGAECKGEPLPSRAARVAQRPKAPAAPPPPRELAKVEPAAAPPKADTAAAKSAPAAGPPLATAEIRFDSGSSFFPRGAEKELQRLVAALPKERGYRFELAAGVDDALVREGDPAESARYNRWLAERRLVRVGGWLEQHAEVRDLAIGQALQETERSPRVLIRVLPSAPPAR
jgi:outer membrane protein OmpA-like peptidoglycan-associated protein